MKRLLLLLLAAPLYAGTVTTTPGTGSITTTPGTGSITFNYAAPVVAPAGNSDAFTGADTTALATHDANWVSMDATNVVGSCVIMSNTAQTSGNWTYCGAMYNTSSSDTSQALFKAYADDATNKEVCVRAGVDAGANKTGYCLRLTVPSGGNFTRMGFYKGGAYMADIRPMTFATASDHTVKITASGSGTVTLTGYVDGSLIGTTTDSTSPYGTGKPGISVTGNGDATITGIDDWQDY